VWLVMNLDTIYVDDAYEAYWVAIHRQPWTRPNRIAADKINLRPDGSSEVGLGDRFDITVCWRQTGVSSDGRACAENANRSSEECCPQHVLRGLTRPR
jgi:hypothetical protein